MSEKATRNPRQQPKKRQNVAQMRRFEREGREEIAQAFERYAIKLMRGTSGKDPQEVLRRIGDPKYNGDLKRTLNELLHKWTMAGADNGIKTVQRSVFGQRG
jgi:hypothetical protein